MINPSEFRIGNFILVEISPDLPRPHRLTAKDIFDIASGKISPSCIEYIQLTPRILEACGLDECSDGNEYRIGLPIGHGTDLVVEVLEEVNSPYDALISNTTVDQRPDKYSYIKQQKYLHQFQNTFHALTGVELEIKEFWR